MAFIPFPSGTILAFAGSTAPSGWLLCDGTDYLQTDYPELYSVITTTYNTQPNPAAGGNWAAPAAGRFRVPDYRGTFLRSVGTASGKDATSLGGLQGEKTKTPGAAFTVAGSSYIPSGSVNSTNSAHGHDDIRIANYSYNGNNKVYLGGGGQNSGISFGQNGSTQSTMGAFADSSGSTHLHTWQGALGTTNATSVNGGGDNETRPLNKGVYYIIKI